MKVDAVVGLVGMTFLNEVGYHSIHDKNSTALADVFIDFYGELSFATGDNETTGNVKIGARF